MIADFSLVENNPDFMIHPHQVAGETVLLIQPVFIGAKWTKETRIFRSSVWNLKGEPVSLSFPKFFNFGEHPEIIPIPESLAGSELIEKIDGSTILISHYRDELVIRTRGTVDARKQNNGYEIDQFIQKYPLLFDNEYVNDGSYTVVGEWYSPSNKIVIDLGLEPLIYLTAIIRHEDYSLVRQHVLDELAIKWKVLRPQTYHYDSLEQMKQAVTDFRGKEGVCIYFHSGQEILKFKSAFYLYLHRAKSEISSIEKVMDLYLDVYFNSIPIKAPTFSEFIEYLTTTFDYEIAQMAIPNVSQICDAMKEVKLIVDAMTVFVDPLRIVGRRDAAAKILQAWGNTSRSSFAFKLLDGKALGAEDLKKLLFQCLKK